MWWCNAAMLPFPSSCSISTTTLSSLPLQCVKKQMGEEKEEEEGECVNVNIRT